MIGLRKRLLLLVGSLITHTAHAQIYCVDDVFGNDNNSGICASGITTQAWKSAAKVSNTIFAPGDVVEFKRGGVWNEILTLKNYTGSDIADAPVTVSAWGLADDPLPIIDGSGVAGGLAFRSYRSYIIVRDIHFKSDDVGMGLSASGGNISVLLDGIKVEMDPTIATKGILFSKGGDDITIRNLELTGASNLGINFAGDVSNHIGNVLVEDSKITGAGPTFSGNDGIAIHENSSGGTAGSGFVFRNNTVEDFPEQGFDITTGTDVTLIGNITRNNGKGAITVGHSASNVTIDQHESYDEPANNTAAAINISSRDVTVKNSVVTGSTGYHMVNIYNGSIEVNGTDADNINIINNTFVWDRSSSLFTIGEIVDVTIENNIFVTARQDFGPCVLDFVDTATTPAFTGLHINYNQYYSPGSDVCFKEGYAGQTAVYYSFSEFQSAFGHESNGLISDPQLVSLSHSSANYHTTPGSTAIDAGNPVAAFSLEPENNGNRINIGRYGNTDEATSGIDTDGDGLTDQNERCFDGDCSTYDPYSSGSDLDLADKDTDADGYEDGQEVAAGSNPLSASSTPIVAAPVIGIVGFATVLLGILISGISKIRSSKGV